MSDLTPISQIAGEIDRKTAADAIQYDEPQTEEERRRRWEVALVKSSGLPLFTAQKMRFGNFIKRNKCLTDALAVAKLFVTPEREHNFLTFSSQVKGLGKTHLAIAIGWDWLERTRKPIRYSQAGELMDELRSGLHAENPYQKAEFDAIMNRLKSVSLLIIDDLGAEYSTEWVKEKLDIIVNFRYLNRLPLVVTTNLPAVQLESRISSRLMEGVVMPLVATDYRLEIAKMRQVKKELAK
jgi:DNA replication protein DnaC